MSTTIDKLRPKYFSQLIFMKIVAVKTNWHSYNLWKSTGSGFIRSKASNGWQRMTSLSSLGIPKLIDLCWRRNSNGSDGIQCQNGPHYTWFLILSRAIIFIHLGVVSDIKCRTWNSIGKIIDDFSCQSSLREKMLTDGWGLHSSQRITEYYSMQTGPSDQLNYANQGAHLS